jgi:hypothetical protein
MPPHTAKVLLPCLFFSTFKGHKFKRDNGQISTDHNQIQTWPAAIAIFSKFQRDNSAKHQWTITKFEFDLGIPMLNLHMQFEPYTYIQTKVSEQKLNFFQEGYLCQKNHQTMTYFEIDLHNPKMY